MHKESIAVYNPSDPIERSIQEQYHNTSGQWLTACDCQLLSKALGSLKSFDGWLENPKVLDHRISYFFASFMSKNKKNMVFLTHPLFLRDILENCEINSYLYDPIVFVTPSLAHYLFQEYPVHLYVDSSKLKGYNDVHWVDIGGLLVCNREDVKIDAGFITGILSKPECQETVSGIMSDVRQLKGSSMSKAALSQVSPGIFKIDRHERDIEPDEMVWDKHERKNAIITRVEPGETGLVAIKYEDGYELSLPKEDFDTRYTVMQEY